MAVGGKEGPGDGCVPRGAAGRAVAFVINRISSQTKNVKAGEANAVAEMAFVRAWEAQWKVLGEGNSEQMKR